MIKKKTRKPKETEHITLGHTDRNRREMLLFNASRGVGKATEKNGNVILRLGSESYGLIIFTILNAKVNPNGSIQL